MTLTQIIAELVESNEKLKAQSENFEQALAEERASGVEEGMRSRDQEVADLIVMKDNEKAVFGAEEYQRGVIDGRSEDQDLIYTEADMEAVKGAHASALEELRLAVEAERVAFQGQIDALSQQVADLDASIPGKIADAVAAVKADLKAKYIEQQVAEADGETGFGSLLD